mgnify:CR=1 FL=1
MSFGLEYTAFVAMKKTSNIKKIRYIIDIIQIGIVIWGLSLRDLVKTIPVDEKEAVDDDVQKI